MSATAMTPLFSSAVIATSNDHLRHQLVASLVSSRCDVQEARGGAEALAKLEGGSYQALLLDRWLPDLDVGELLQLVKKLHPQVKILMIDSEAGSAVADETLPATGSGFTIEKWPAPGALESRPARELPEHDAESRKFEPLPGMIGISQSMQEVYRLSRLVATRSTTVLLSGETGTGKELVAKAIHLLSTRHRQPFITVNCAAIPEALLEAELFGYARGAFTGAFQSRMGRIHAAHGGTLFLDEVADLPLSMQAKLLRFLQDGEVQRLGGPETIRVDVRVIAATNAQLSKRVSERAFRDDLFYRISVFPIDLVPLRDRRDDILPLGNHFLILFCQEAHSPRKHITAAAADMLLKHPWPGNVRELRHVMERAFIVSESATEILPAQVGLQTLCR